MSTSWDVWCTDCDEGAGLDIVNNERFAHELIRDAPMIATLLPAKEAGVDVEVNPWYQTGNRVSIPWFAKHAGHRLKPKNEYGKYDDACAAYVDCPGCGRQFSCNEVEGHAGKHQPRRSK